MEADSENYSAMDNRSFTFRALFSGLLIGVLVNLSNTYYGLRIGAGSQMSMVSGLLGFMTLKLISIYTARASSAAENVLIISMATATGRMSVTAGIVGIIPALEYLIGPEENGPLHIDWGSLLLWSMVLCVFGLIFASLLREYFVFVVREKLPWPGAKATAHLIKTLNHIPPKLPTATEDTSDSLSSGLAEAAAGDYDRSAMEEQQPLLGCRNDTKWKVGMKRLLQGGTVSGIFV